MTFQNVCHVVCHVSGQFARELIKDKAAYDVFVETRGGRWRLGDDDTYVFTHIQRESARARARTTERERERERKYVCMYVCMYA